MLLLNPTLSFLPDMAVAPFWRPISCEEYGSYFGEQAEPDSLAFVPGWTLALYSGRLESPRRVSLVGWVHGHFGVVDALGEDDGMLGMLHHLPTGRLIGTFATAELAAFAAEATTDLTDWSALTELKVGDLPRRYRDRLEEVGFHHRVMPLAAGRMVPVWFREIGGLN